MENLFDTMFADLTVFYVVEVSRGRGRLTSEDQPISEPIAFAVPCAARDYKRPQHDPCSYEPASYQ